MFSIPNCVSLYIFAIASSALGAWAAVAPHVPSSIDRGLEEEGSWISSARTRPLARGCHLAGRLVQPGAVAIVNSAPFHNEIYLAVLSALEMRYAGCVTAYVHPAHLPVRSYSLVGAKEVHPHGVLQLLQQMPYQLRELPPTVNGTVRGPVDAHELAIFITPEFNPPAVAAFLSASRARSAVFLLHDPVKVNATDLLALMPPPGTAHVAALGPHVVEAALASSGVRPQLIVPSYRYRPSEEEACFDGGEVRTLRPGCLSGLVVQGMIDPGRRSYEELYKELSALAAHPGATMQSASLRLKLVGEVHNWSNSSSVLAVPPAVRGSVSLHVNLPFADFYAEIYRSLALVPALAKPEYLSTKITSTSITSLATGVPMVVDEPFLAAYTYLDSSTAIVKAEGESLASVYGRLMAMPASQYLAYRTRLEALAAQLNGEAADWLGGLLLEVIAPEEAAAAKATMARSRLRSVRSSRYRAK